MALRVASLLPSATETLLALGITPCAVSHSCDFSEVRDVPVVTSTDIDSGQSQTGIDHQVANHDGPLYALDLAKLATLRPDVVVTQTICRVCAIDGRDLDHRELPGILFTMDATSFDELPNDFLSLGQTVGRRSRSSTLVADW